jgi:hypothetical protein
MAARRVRAVQLDRNAREALRPKIRRDAAPNERRAAGDSKRRGA